MRYGSGSVKAAKRWRHENYWLERFAGELPVLQLRADYPRPAVQQFQGDQVSFTLDRELTAGLRRLAEETETTMYMVLLTAYKTLLFRYSGQEDLIVGTPVAGRAHADLERVMGMFVNTLALRSYPSGEKTFVSFLEEVKEQMLESLQHQDYPFEMLVEQLQLSRDASRNPLFDTMFDLQSAELHNLELAGLRISPYEADNRSSKFDLTLEASEGESEIQFSVEYSTALFRKETIQRMTGHFLQLIQAVIDNREARIAELELLTEAEQTEILREFNGTDMEYPRDKMIHELFEVQAEKTPDSVAVVFEDETLTYRELNARANQLARVLRTRGLKPDHLIGIMVNRSVDMVIAALGVWKSGGAYVPIDPEYPRDRIQYMLEESKAQLLLTQQAFSEQVSFSGEVIYLEDQSIQAAEATNLESVTKLNDLAYVIFTSGTTGKPKGVMIEHGHIQSMVYAWSEGYRLDTFQVNLLQMASFSFDVFVGDLARALLHGGKLVICPNEARLDPAAWSGIISKHEITFLESTPALIFPLMEVMEEEQLRTLKIVVVGSDSCPVPDFEKLQDKLGSRVRLINSFGVTEASVDASFYEEDAAADRTNRLYGGSMPIGKPMSNVKHLYYE